MCGGSAVPRALIEGYLDDVRRADRAGLGDDRDQPGVHDRPSAEGHGRRRRGRLAGYARAASCPASNCGSPTTTARRSRGTASRSARSRCAGRGSPPRTTGVDDPDKFHDGWLRTGDVASVSPNGYVMISDRAKDVIKSGGEWVSSVDLENTLMGHPDVARGGGHRCARRAVGRTAAGVRRAQSRLAGHGRRAARAGSPNEPPSSGCRSGGRSSPRCRRPASASSTRRCCVPATPPISWRSRRWLRALPCV